MNIADTLPRLKAHVAAGRLDAAWGDLRCMLLEPYKVLGLQKLNREIAANADAWRKFVQGRVLRIAVLGGYTTQPVKELLLPLALAEGCWAEIYEGTFNTFETEPLDASSPLYAFKPDIVLIASGTVNLPYLPPPGAGEAEIAELADRVISALRLRWQAITTNSGARIIQHNFEMPSALPLGRLEGRHPWSGTNFIHRLNARLWQHDGHEVRLLDVHQIATDCGRRQWHEPRWYHHSKHGFDPNLIHAYGCALAGLLRAMLGKTRKCLVTDLDNTLWGGVVGDDGVDGIELGNGSATGEAFAAFGRYLKSLRQAGVVLAVNSKNESKLATEVFARHPETPLRLNDFAAFMCNWNSKSENLRTISQQLNLGLDSLVFMDDNPAECEEVRAALPEVTVIELGGDPAYFPQRLEELHLFTPLDFTHEDMGRAKSYEAQKELSAHADSASDLAVYLAGLEMEATMRRAEPSDLPRLEQLFGKTNQFNLTGRSYNRDELDRFTQDPQALVLSVSMQDRLANHGLVAAVVARFEQSMLIVDNWVMSCRVFTRTLEACVFNWLSDVARMNDCKSVRGLLIPTEKNGYAQRFFAQLDWQPNEDGGQSAYRFCLADSKPLNTFVKCLEK